jgi:hypothetical protein
LRILVKVAGIMRGIHRLIFLLLLSFWSLPAGAQITNALPGRILVKLTPDYLRPVVYALNAGTAPNTGTLLALNATNGSLLNEISVGLNPTDMTVTSAGDSLYVINAGSRTISKVNLTSFTVQSSVAISTPNTYSLSNPLYLVANNSGTIFFTDGAWGPEIYDLDYASGNETLVLDTGGNEYAGAGGLVLSKDGSMLYIWQQYGWSAGSENSAIVSLSVGSDSLTALTSGPNQNRDPLNTPIFLDGAERWVFNKIQMVSATNTSVLLTQFTDNIYAISLDGSVAFGPTEVFNTQTGITITNLPFASTVQSLSGDQTELFRCNSSTGGVVIYDMASIASISGLALVPTPADGSVVAQAPTNLLWSPSAVALSYDVYFGTNQTAVATATTASPLYLGRTTATSIAPGQQINSGDTYYWRVDAVGFDATNQGNAWSFTVSTLVINPTQISVGGIAGYNPGNVSLSLTSAAPVAWSAAVTGSPWLTLNSTNGTTSSTLNISFNTAALAVGTYTNNVEFRVGSLKVAVPVTVNIAALNIIAMAADRERPYIYALQPPVLTGQNGQLLFINTLTGNIDNTLAIGINPTDLSVNYGENRLYIASWGEGATYVVDLTAQTLLPSLLLGTDIYKISAGGAGTIITEGEDQWIAVNLVSTLDGSVIAGFPYPQREGDGKADPTGNYYYHCDNNISDAHVHKFYIGNDAPAEIADSNQHPFGTRNLVMSEDGNRLFWNSYFYDTNLTELGTLGTEIYSCSSNGAVAFGGSQAFDPTSLLVIYNLPVPTSVSVVDGQNQNFWYFNGAAGTLGSVPMSVIQSPSIIVQPAASTEVGVGGNVYFTSTAMGLSPLTYTWTLAGTNLPGATNYFLSINNIQAGQQGDYRVIVSNSFGSVTSAVAQIIVLTPPAITNQPQSTTVPAGATFSLAVGVAGTPPFSYLWTFEGFVISGATNSILTLSNAQPNNEGIYTVIVANPAGSVTSSVAVVRVTPTAPVILNNPVSLILPASSNAVFSVTATGGQLAYEWFFNGNPIAGATNAQYTIQNIQSSNGGNYQVVISNSLGTTNSAIAALTVTPLAPYFVTQPQGGTNLAGTTRTFTGLAEGSQPITYQWQHDGDVLPGANQASLALTNLGLGDAGSYALVASNIAGVSTSAVVQLAVYQEPTLSEPLTNLVVEKGSTLTLAAPATGSSPLIWSWQFDGMPIPGTNATLLITDIQQGQSGYYTATISNMYGTVSSTGRVSVFGPPSMIIAWGDDSEGQTNVPPGFNDIVAVAGGDYHSLALHQTGTLAAWGYNGDGQTSVPTNSLRFVSIAAGANHNLAIAENGVLYAWGLNDADQTNIPAAAASNVVSVAAGDSHSLALLASGTVVAWGDNTFGQTSVPAGLAGVSAIAAGRFHSLALLTNGTVTGWGFNAYGQTMAPTTLTNAMAISGGYLHSVALCSNGTVVAWGDNTFGQTNTPAGLSNIVAIAAGDFETIALGADGSLVGWGDAAYGQLQIPSDATNCAGIASGYYHALALIPVPLLSYSFSGAGMVIYWNSSAVLQWATNLVGPYTDISGANQQYSNTDFSLPAKFFRLRR